MFRRSEACFAAALIVAASQLLESQSAFKSQSDLVRVQAVVRDRSGRLLSGLGKEDFEIRDNGALVEITAFTNIPEPLSVVLLVDRSKSMTAYPTVRTAVAEFLDSLNPGDRVSLHSLGALAVPFTTEKARLLTGLAEIEAEPGSPVWSALQRVLTAVAAESGRRVVIAFTDAIDESGQPPPVDLRNRVIQADAAFSIIGYGPSLSARINDTRTSAWHANTAKLQDELHSITNVSGGTLVISSRTSDIEETFRTMSEELRSQYGLGFSPSTADGRVHQLVTRVRIPGAKVRARGSYWAPLGKERSLQSR